MTRLTAPTFIGCALAAVLLMVARGDAPPAALASHAGGADSITIDMDPDATPANTATSLGTREECAQIVVNGVQDADEDLIDAVSVDVAITNVPVSTPAVAYGFTLNYDESEIDLQASQAAFFLAANAGSTTLDVSTPLPDTDGNDRWSGSELDYSDTVHETGSGVLQRLTLGAETGASTGLYDLVLSNTGTLDTSGDDFEVDALHFGLVSD